MSKPRCPVCNRQGEPCGELYRCAIGHLFDGTPEEGGDYHSDPTRRIEKQEERELARRANVEGRGRASKPFRFGGHR